MKKKQKQQSGFTLIELLVVISIISLLASIMLVALNGARLKARDVKRLADKTQLIKAFNLYYNDNPDIGWPDTAGNWMCLGPSSENCWNGSFSGNDTLVTTLSPYVKLLPNTNAISGNYGYNRFLYNSNFTYSTQTGAWLVWFQEQPIAANQCSSTFPIAHYDLYYYCYEFLGTK